MKVSIIIPVYNAQNYLNRCLDSVVNQTLKDIEIICVNDCSTDDSLSILKCYATTNNNLKIIDCKVNGGESVARNIGIEHATGEFIAFVDNDDVIDLDFLEKLYIKACDTNADIVKGEAKSITYDGKKLIRQTNPLIRNNKYYFTGNWWTAIYRSELIHNNKIKLPEGFLISGDLLFVNKAVLCANKVETVDGVYYCHYDRENSGFSKILSTEKVLSGLKICEIILDNINEFNLYKKNEEGYLYIFLDQVIRVILSISFRICSEEDRMTCAQFLVLLYQKSFIKDKLDDEIKKTYPLLYDSLSCNDVKKLYECLKKNDTNVKFMTANFRKSILNRS